jgi:glutamine amidotransferase
MCRVLAYLGEPVLLDDLLYRPDNSLVKQAYAPEMLHMLNLAGFGLAAWDPHLFDASAPLVYKSVTLPVFDANLKQLAQKLRARCLLAHVRGVAYHSRVHIGEYNLHPFKYDGFRVAMAHNGDLHRFDEMKYRLVAHLKPAIAQRIRGTTDSEWMYAVLMSQLEDPTASPTALELAHAVEKMLKVIRVERDHAGICTQSPVNLFISDGASIVGVRFTFDFGCYPQEDAARIHEMQLRYLSCWYTSGRSYGVHDGEWRMTGGSRAATSVIVASEPLTRDATTWLEVPEYSILHVDARGGKPKIGVMELDV